MESTRSILCEIFLRDHRSGQITSLVGKLNMNTIESLQFEESNFIMFEESYHPPIFKEDIQEIILYKVDIKKSINSNVLQLHKILRSRISAKIS